MSKIETEQCFICKLTIYKDKDRFVRITDFSGKDEGNSLFSHTVCWMEHLSNKKMMRQALTNQNKVLEKVGLA